MLCTCLCCNLAQGIEGGGGGEGGETAMGTGGFRKEISQWPQFSGKWMWSIFFSKCTMWLGEERHEKDHSCHWQQRQLFLKYGPCGRHNTKKALIGLLPLVLTCSNYETDSITPILQMRKPNFGELKKHLLVRNLVKAGLKLSSVWNQNCHAGKGVCCTTQGARHITGNVMTAPSVLLRTITRLIYKITL